MYPRSFADSDGDGTGDVNGIRSKLPYLRDLGVDAIWISPWYTSPLNDGGYDVADYRDIDPRFGTLADAEALFEDAHAHGIKVIVDLVPNHSSSEHPWFKAALAAGPGSPERARYIFKDGKGKDGSVPPTNWTARVRRLGVGARRRWPVVPAPLRPHPARPQLGERGGPSRVRRHLPLLARPRRRRLPDRRRPRARQGPDLSRHRRGSEGAGEQPPPQPPVLGPRRHPRDQPPVASRARQLRPRRDDGRRGVGRPVPCAALPAARRVPPVVQLRLPRDAVGHRRREAGDRPRRHRGTHGRLDIDVDAVEPRRDAPRQPLRIAQEGGLARLAVERAGREVGEATRCRARPAPGTSGHDAAARPARLDVHLPRRGARPARRVGPSARGARRPDVGATRATR